MFLWNDGVDSAIHAENKGRQAKWAQGIAVGSETFIEKIKEALDFRARGRKIRRADDSFELWETLKPYGTTYALASGYTFSWDQ